jgi:1,4-dihydroxy-2-naphthoate octaprenyltransferase
VLVIITQHWWLLAVGVASVLAAWFYTGGKRPYGYNGLGELFVFVFFGLVATCGTGYVQTGRISPALAVAAVGIGAFACALLVVNNLRDIESDRAVGKRTLATRMGYRGTRSFFVALISLSAIMINVVAALTSAWALLGLVGMATIIPAARTVLAGARGPDLIGVLKSTGLAELVAAIGLAAGLVIAAL